MATKNYKPTSAGRRSRQVMDYSGLSKVRPEKSLTTTLTRNSGRNNSGQITVRHRAGGVKRLYRIVDYRRHKDGILGTVVTIEYDPYRTSNLALISYLDGSKAYIIAPDKLAIGDKISSGPDADIRIGNALPLEKIPVGTIIHNVELVAGKGGQLARAAGSYVTLVAKSGDYAVLKLPSGEVRQINLQCRATVGQVGNHERRNRSLGKAGASRWLGRRPQVRGAVMNPCDHPHGGGEGKAPVGRYAPMTPWGKPALGLKTRKERKASGRFIVTHRKKG
ncbi:50S ribosomal protein L2 [bacterium]|nr:50S ribosomal protein L2 [bacterium]